MTKPANQKTINVLNEYLKELPRLRSIAYRYLQDNADTQDVLQEVYIKAAKHLGTGFRGDSSVYTWLFAVTRNAAINASQRRQCRDKRQPSFDALYTSNLRPGDGFEGHTVPNGFDLLVQSHNLSSPDTYLESKQCLAKLSQAFNELAIHNPRVHEVFSRVVLEDQPIAQVAEELGITASSARGQVYQARRILFKKLKELQPEKDYSKFLRPRAEREALLDQAHESEAVKKDANY